MDSYLTSCRPSRKCFSTGPSRCDSVFEHVYMCVFEWPHSPQPSASWTPHERTFLVHRGEVMGREVKDRGGHSILQAHSYKLNQRSSVFSEDLTSTPLLLLPLSLPPHLSLPFHPHLLPSAGLYLGFSPSAISVSIPLPTPPPDPPPILHSTHFFLPTSSPTLCAQCPGQIQLAPW